MAYVILFRNTRSKRVGYVSDGGDNDNVRAFPTWEDAAEMARQVPICQAYPYEIVKLEI